MKLFSKRNSPLGISGLEERRIGSRFVGRRTELVSLEARNRLISEVKYLSSCNDFLEWFILFEDQRRNKIYFDKAKIDSFSLAELGYSMSEHFEFEEFKMLQQHRKIRYATGDDREDVYFDDYRLFDIAEITILFSKKSQRKNVIARFNTILDEENTGYQIVEHLITKRDGEELKHLVNIIKDQNLKTKLKRYFDFEESGEYISAAKFSADILNIVFSGVIKTNKKKEINQLKSKIIDKLIGSKEVNSDKGVRLNGYIDDLLKTAKNLSNDIYDVRHTEKSTIEVSNNLVYKTIAMHNMLIVELALTTLKDDFVLSSDWEIIKQEYIEKYKIDPKTRLTIRKPKPEDPISLDDIPF